MKKKKKPTALDRRRPTTVKKRMRRVAKKAKARHRKLKAEEERLMIAGNTVDPVAAEMAEAVAESGGDLADEDNELIPKEGEKAAKVSDPEEL